MRLLIGSSILKFQLRSVPQYSVCGGLRIESPIKQIFDSSRVSADSIGRFADQGSVSNIVERELTRYALALAILLPLLKGQPALAASAKQILLSAFSTTFWLILAIGTISSSPQTRQGFSRLARSWSQQAPTVGDFTGVVVKPTHCFRGHQRKVDRVLFIVDKLALVIHLIVGIADGDTDQADAINTCGDNSVASIGNFLELKYSVVVRSGRSHDVVTFKQQNLGRTNINRSSADRVHLMNTTQKPTISSGLYPMAGD